MMKEITLKCKIITPLFMGGANQEAELRTQSFNGLFRYWFRLLGGSFEDEKRLFGWGGEGARKGLVQVFIEVDKITVNKQKIQNFIISGQEWLKHEKGRQEKEIEKLKGSSKDPSKSQNKKESDKINKKIQRLMENVKELDSNIDELKRFENSIKNNDLTYTKLKEWRKAISILFRALTLKYKGLDYLGFSLKLLKRDFCPLDVSFCLTIRFHPTANDEDIKKFLSALWCAFYLGNFGSRSRRGFGSVMIENIEGYIPEGFDVEFKPSGDMCNWLKEQLKKTKYLNCWKGREDIPWIFENMEIYRFGGAKQNFEDILNELGEKYKDYRRTKHIQDKIWFGLPIQKFIPQLGNEKLRRASPLIFKIISDGQNYEGFIIVFKPSDRHKLSFY